ncbi:hypothetical protein ACSLBF_11460 [Pseudoalteromonas sp. T1lg65]
MDLNLYKGLSGFVANNTYPTLPCPHGSQHTLKLDIACIRV